jgi:hypothetical protein
MSVAASERASERAASESAATSEVAAPAEQLQEHNLSADASAPVASTTSVAAPAVASFNEVETTTETSEVSAFNEVGIGSESLADTQVPLAVRLDDVDDTLDITTIEDEETPLAITKSSVAGKNWWYGILLVISLITGKVAGKKRNEEINAEK